MGRWLEADRPRLERLAARSRVARVVVGSLPATPGQFTVAVALVGLLFVAVTLLGTLVPRAGGLVVYAVFLGGFFAHGFVHVGQAVAFRGYTPGVVTAVVVVVPVSVYLYGVVLATGLLDLPVVVATTVAGLLLFVPIVAVAQRLAATVA